jgi:serine O-acetyltransferase
MTASSLRLIPHVILMLYSGRRHLIEADLARWAEILLFTKPQKRLEFIKIFITLMTFLPEFRNLFYLRAGKTSRIFSWMCRGLIDLDIASSSIGPGLFIQHGNSTFVSAVSIGTNCWIGRHVVVGYSNETDIPTIGDNVRIFAGAKIIGKVIIGNNATIGLNTVVLDDVPANATVFGVPGRVIWKTCTKL